MNIGDTLEPYGTVVAVGYIGERYYWFKDENGDIAMMPASVIDELEEMEE